MRTVSCQGVSGVSQPASRKSCVINSRGWQRLHSTCVDSAAFGGRHAFQSVDLLAVGHSDRVLELGVTSSLRRGFEE